MKVNNILFLFIVLLLFACSGKNNSSPVFGGNEVPNLIKGKIVAENNNISIMNREIQLKRVKIISNGEIACKTYYAFTDSGGNFQFIDVDEGVYALHCLDKGDRYSALVNQIEVTDSTKLDTTLTLKKEVVIIGRVLLDSGLDYRAVKVFSIGDNVDSYLNGDGFYILDGVTRDVKFIAISYGDYINLIDIKLIGDKDTFYLRDVELRINTADKSSEVLKYNSLVPNVVLVAPKIYSTETEPNWYKGKDFTGVLYYEYINGEEKEISNFFDLEVKDSVLFDDFDHGTVLSENYLAELAGLYYYNSDDSGGGWWYVYSDLQRGGNSRVVPESAFSDFSTAIKREEDNNWLEVTFELKDGFAYPFGGVGVIIGKSSDTPHDLSSLSAISFRAKGKGNFYLKLYTNDYDDKMNDNMCLAKKITLNDNWSFYKISVNDLSPLPSSEAESIGLTWDMIKNKITKIQIETSPEYGPNNTLSLALDDIYFYNYGLSLLLQDYK